MVFRAVRRIIGNGGWWLVVGVDPQGKAIVNRKLKYLHGRGLSLNHPEMAW
jgi:hypothetical protein